MDKNIVVNTEKKPEFMVYCGVDLRKRLEEIARLEKRSLSNIAVLALEDFIKAYNKTETV